MSNPGNSGTNPDDRMRSINESDQGRSTKGERGRTTTTSEKPPKPKTPKR